MTQPATNAAPTSRYAPPRACGPIIAAVGGDDRNSVLRTTQRIAAQCGAEVIAVTVLEPIPASSAGTELLILPLTLESERRTALRLRLGADVDREIGRSPTWRIGVVDGDPATAITDVAQHEGARLVVMGIGRHALIDRLLGAETALRTIRRAPCPVLAVGPAASSFRTVVVATDFSAASVYAVECVRPLLSPGATLHVVHAWRAVGAHNAVAHAIDDAFERSLPGRLASFITALDVGADVTVTSEARQGAAASVILACAEARNADLIVAGRHGAGVLERLFVGSVTTSLLRRARCTVFVAPKHPRSGD